MTTGLTPGPLSKVPCPVPGCDRWYSGRPRVAGCTKCRSRAWRRLNPQPKKPRNPPPRFPCPTPRCEGTYGGRSAIGCVKCQDRHQHKKLKAERKCPRCVKKLPPGHDRRLCPTCLPEENHRQRIARSEWVEQGKCTSCPNPAAPWATRCERCLARQKKCRPKASERRRQAQRRANQPNHQRAGR